MRLPRFTLRRLMVLVAVAGLALGIERSRRRREALLVAESKHATEAAMYRQSSDLYASNAWKHRAQAAKIRQGFRASPSKATALDQLAGLVEGEAHGYGALADYHDAMREKYRRAARFPFWPVEPDPPSPPDLDEF
jgi:hypothetical protein